MNDFGKVLLVVLAILYCVSPVDLCPGPIDDVIVLALSIAARKDSFLSKE